MKILIADDHRFIVDDLTDEVKKCLPDAQFDGTSEPDQVLPMFTENLYDVVFMDINMPGCSGIKLAKKLLAIQPRTNIIYITGFEEYALESYKTYASAFLVKPITSGMVRDVLSNLRHPVSDITDEMIENEFSGKGFIGKIIERYREERGMTKQELADAMGVALQTVYRWESGEREPNIATFLRLSKVLGVNFDKTLSGISQANTDEREQFH